jgi:threonine aldolase
MDSPRETGTMKSGGIGIDVDLLSDTVTRQPPGMVEAMHRARVGDDGYGEDPTVNELEARTAERLGKEAAIFVASGTMANLLSLLTHCPRGRKILVGDQTDLWLWEAGGAAVLGGLVYQPLPNRPNGELGLDDLERAVAGADNPDCAEAGVVCLEDTHCLSGGRVLALDYLASVRAFADRHGLPVHLDGARLWNAAVALGSDVREITRHADSVCFCLSKGLAAPVGSLIAGSRDFVARVRRLRKMLGGQMRQAGFLAAAGLYALDGMVDRLAEDHAHARLLAAGLATLPGVILDPPVPETNIVFWRLAEPGLSVASFLAGLEEHGVRVGQLGEGRLRAVTHYGIRRADIETAVAAVREALAGSAVREVQVV